MAATIPTETITLEAALEIARTTLAHGQAQKMKPLAVAVLDPRGALKAYLADDGTSLLRLDIAFGKAWGTLGMGFGGREFARRSAKAPSFMNALMAASDGRIVPAQGGLLIRNAAGQIVGAIGVTGDTSENDEACAVVGIRKVGLVPDTGDPA
ncbi:MAG: heme-binding protein [Alphaproteobacteria bacterium]|nr:heme-binding protein [Alphaproteobacteria bacterium]